MKQFYQIHELAKLFDLCPDTLRYYEEKGLLHPVRGENRYRMYGIQDVCTLNIIRALRELGLPTRAIRAYLERRSVGETLALLDREEALLRRRMAELALTSRITNKFAFIECNSAYISFICLYLHYCAVAQKKL